MLVGDIGTRGNSGGGGAPTAAGLGGSAAVERAAAILAPADVSFKFNQAHASAPGGARNELAVMSTYGDETLTLTLILTPTLTLPVPLTLTLSPNPNPRLVALRLGAAQRGRRVR